MPPPPLYLLLALFSKFSWFQKGAVSLGKGGGGADGRGKEKVLPLWIAASNYSSSASETAAYASFSSMCWNDTEDSCSSLSALDRS